MTRRGRFDEVFYVALPDEAERASVWRIHLGKVAQLENVGDDGVAMLARMTDGFSGAEIEQVVHDAMYDSYTDGEPLKLSAEKVAAAVAATTPLARARSVELEALDRWARANARHASIPPARFHEGAAAVQAGYTPIEL